MRTTRSSWALLAGTALAVATSICVVDRYGPPVGAPTRSDLPGYEGPPVRYERHALPSMRQFNRPTERPQFDPPLPDLTPMILYMSPGFQSAPR
jgi:hypothetical protein